MKLFINAALPTSSTALKKVNVLFDERILRISADGISTEEPPEVIDLQGRILLPGGVDAHSHVIAEAEPGKTLGKVTRAALTGGWTTLAELSYFNPRPVFSLQDLAALKDTINAHSFVDMAVWGNVDIDDYPYHAEAAQELWAAGVVGLALMSPSPNPAITTLSFTEIMDLFIDIYESDTTFAFQGYDYESSQEFSFGSQCDAIKKILRRMQENPIHIPRVSNYPTIEFINSISKRSDISFSFCISDLMHFYSHLADGRPLDIVDFHDLFFDLLRGNKLYMLSTNAESAQTPAERSYAFAGSSEKLLPYSYLWVLSELWKKRKVPLATVIKMTSENPAKRLGLYPQKGCLEAGSDADFAIYDPAKTTVFPSPDGNKHTLTGSIDEVYLKGALVHTKGKTAAASGAWLPRHTVPKRRHNSTTWF